MMRRSVIAKCYASSEKPNIPQVNSNMCSCIPLRKQLENRRDYIRGRIRTLEMEQVTSRLARVESEELYKALAIVNAKLVEHNLDPLSTEICESEPWSQECKLFDL